MGDATEPRIERGHYIPSIDGLRALAVLAVLVYHLDAALLPGGFTGVDIFFVISGYVVSASLARERSRGFVRFTLGFYARRILRIFPALIVCLVLVTLLSTAFIPEAWLSQSSDKTGLYAFFGISNFALVLFNDGYFSPRVDYNPFTHTWSLAVEEQFYLIWPVLLLLVPRRWILPLLGVLVAANVLGMLWQMQATPPETGVLRWALPNATYAPILMGAAMAVLLHQPRGFAALWSVIGGRWSALVWGVVVVALIVVLPDDLRGWPNLALHLAMCALVGACVIREDNGLAGALQLRPLVRLGAVSYGVYLYHLLVLHPVLMGTERFDLSLGWGLFAVYAVASYIVAEISFATWERYFTRFQGRPWGSAPRVEVRS